MLIGLVLAALLAGYALGGVPFGLLLARAAGKGDLRAIGSGNIGATNALRAGGPWLGAATLLLDAAKGAVGVLGGAALAGADGALAGGAGAFLGHLYSPWLAFKGGKGVATMIGVAGALVPWAGAAYLAAWAALAAITRRSSAGGIAGALAAVAAAFAIGPERAAWLLAAMAALLIWKHRTNIARLAAGTEPRIGGGGPKAKV